MTDLNKLRYTETHEWVSLNGRTATVGITDHAQKEISDVVFVELPKPDKTVKQKDSVMIIESVKAAFDIYAPLSGKVVKVNEDLKNQPELVNKS
ncbi:MAG: glycine cleavage system protein H, partial [Candidatus Omnitrophota bacterium]